MGPKILRKINILLYEESSQLTEATGLTNWRSGSDSRCALLRFHSLPGEKLRASLNNNLAFSPGRYKINTNM